jgi:hypothetical protein
MERHFQIFCQSAHIRQKASMGRGVSRRKSVRSLLTCLLLSSLFTLISFLSDPDLWIHPEDSKIITLNAGEIVISESFSAGLTLRFPRITKVRDDADDKPRTEIENDIRLWRVFQDVTESRSAMDSINVTDTNSSFGQKVSHACRFLTEEQFKESDGKPRRQKAATGNQGVVVPKINERDSSLLRGLTFHVFEGTYNLMDDPIAVEESKQDGWFGEGSKVRSSTFVQMFILKHGGKHVLSPDSQDTMVLGGSRLDARVVAYTRSIEAARTMQNNRINKSKKAQIDANIAQKTGCLRWYFVYSLVQKRMNALRSQGQPVDDDMIKEASPELLIPTVFDYLIRPHSKSDFVDGVDSSLLDANVSSILLLRRALEIISETKTTSEKKTAKLEWPVEVTLLFPVLDRFIFDTKFKTLVHDSGNGDPIILYPHIFVGFGDMEPNTIEPVDRREILTDQVTSAIEAAVPLARVMGAIVTTNLHRKVTHVLCDIESEDSVVYDVNLTEDIFSNHPRGRDLLKRLKTMASAELNDILLVSPSWLRKRKWCSNDI